MDPSIDVASPGLPSVDVDVPSVGGGVDVEVPKPSADIDVSAPSASLDIPAGDLAVPSMDVEVPSADLGVSGKLRKYDSPMVSRNQKRTFQTSLKLYRPACEMVLYWPGVYV